MRLYIEIRDPGLKGNAERIAREVCPDFCFVDRAENAEIIILNYPELDLKEIRFDVEKFHGIFHFGGRKTAYPAYNPRKVEFFDLDFSTWKSFGEFLRRICMGYRDLIPNPYKEAAF